MVVFWGVGVVLKVVFVALGVLETLGCFGRVLGVLGGFKWCLGCFESIVGAFLGCCMGAFYGVLGAFGCVGVITIHVRCLMKYR